MHREIQHARNFINSNVHAVFIDGMALRLDTFNLAVAAWLWCCNKVNFECLGRVNQFRK